ncbi:hypothetical protein, partial [Enterococcus durans]|uniref:hypothetical protein n=1 Tax=Enterococcus durans TaxID=53345 RepID=UPI0018A0389B
MDQTKSILYLASFIDSSRFILWFAVHFAIPAEMYSRNAANVGIAVMIVFYICLGFLSMNFKQKEELVTVSGDLGKADFVSKNQLKQADLINGGSGIVFGKLSHSFVERPTNK